MKMNKIVLASLLSVSLLGMSTAAFAMGEEPTSDASTTLKTTQDTKATFSITGGGLSLKSADSEMAFNPLTMEKLVAGTHSTNATQDFSAVVNDTVGGEAGWHLSATYTGMKGADGKTELGDTLSMGEDVKLNALTPTLVRHADATAVKPAMSKNKGDIPVDIDKSVITLDIPDVSKASAQTYEGHINWTLAPDTNKPA